MYNNFFKKKKISDKNAKEKKRKLNETLENDLNTNSSRYVLEYIKENLNSEETVSKITEQQLPEEFETEDCETDCPYSNIEKILKYFSNKNEHLILRIINTKTSTNIFGLFSENLTLPDEVAEMNSFLKQVVSLKSKILQIEKIFTSIDKDSGINSNLSFPKNYVPKAEKFFYCLKHERPLILESEICSNCVFKDFYNIFFFKIFFLIFNYKGDLGRKFNCFLRILLFDWRLNSKYFI